jgi:hypothetical protein
MSSPTLLGGKTLNVKARKNTISTTKIANGAGSYPSKNTRLLTHIIDGTFLKVCPLWKTPSIDDLKKRD